MNNISDPSVWKLILIQSSCKRGWHNLWWVLSYSKNKTCNVATWSIWTNLLSPSLLFKNRDAKLVNWKNLPPSHTTHLKTDVKWVFVSITFNKFKSSCKTCSNPHLCYSPKRLNKKSNKTYNSVTRSSRH